VAVIINEEWLKDHGIEAEEQKAEELIDGVMDELELRVGMEIAEKLTAKQIAEFEKIADEDARVAWLDNAMPDYPKIVEKKTADLSSEIEKSSDKIALIEKWAEES
jgi:hypothetical protein